MAPALIKIFDKEITCPAPLWHALTAAAVSSCRPKTLAVDPPADYLQNCGDLRICATLRASCTGLQFSKAERPGKVLSLLDTDNVKVRVGPLQSYLLVCPNWIQAISIQVMQLIFLLCTEHCMLANNLMLGIIRLAQNVSSNEQSQPTCNFISNFANTWY